ncbi:MAG TPA: sugar phosphate isomerase/epimerase [Egibacteraceae bacterium]
MSRFRIDRREFLRQITGTTVAISAASLAGPLATTAAAAEPGVRLLPRATIGLQLYSVRNLIAELGFGPVFEELSRLGFRKVEFAGYTSPADPGITPAQIRRLLDDNGLEAVGSHRSLGDFRTRLSQELDIAEELGMKHLGTANAPTNDRTIAGYQAAAEEFNTWGEQAIARGIKLYQHNHSIEFSFATDNPDVRLYDVFLEHTDPSLVWLEMDILWAFGGARKYPRPGGAAGTLPRFNPVDYVLAHPERYPLFHVKDGVETPDPNAGNSYIDVEFGAGVIPYAEFFSALRNRLAHIPLWEMDRAPETPPEQGGAFGAAERSIAEMIALTGDMRRTAPRGRP